MLRVFENSKCATIDPRTIFRIRANTRSLLFHLYDFDISPNFFNPERQVLKGDGRADSSGYSAKYGSYNMFDLDCDGHTAGAGKFHNIIILYILDAIIQSNNSYHMEEGLIIRSLQFSKI